MRTLAIALSFLIVASTTLIPVAAAQTPAPAAGQTIVDIAAGDGRFTTLVAAVQAAGLDKALSGPGPFTVFAPTDDAFAKLPAGTVDGLLKDIPALTSILTYHVISGAYKAADVSSMSAAPTLQGKPVLFDFAGGKAMAGGSNIVLTDIEASNGVIHVIDSVMLPPKDIAEVAAADGRFTTLLAAAQAAGWADMLKSSHHLTVFAPTDDAFAKLPAGTVEGLLKDPAALGRILMYHIVPGQYMADDVIARTSLDTFLGQTLAIKTGDGKVMVNDATVVVADVPAFNGTVHAIDTVMLPADAKPAEGAKTIAETAAADGRFKTLLAAVEAAGLTAALSGPGPLTVFAPTDDAFAKLPAGTVEGLLKDIPTLTKILTYHVVPGQLPAANVTRLYSLGTLSGQPLSVSVSEGKVTVGGAHVVLTDIEAENGVIHVIDSVMMP